MSTTVFHLASIFLTCFLHSVIHSCDTLGWSVLSPQIANFCPAHVCTVSVGANYLRLLSSPCGHQRHRLGCKSGPSCLHYSLFCSPCPQFCPVQQYDPGKQAAQNCKIITTIKLFIKHKILSVATIVSSYNTCISACVYQNVSISEWWGGVRKQQKMLEAGWHSARPEALRNSPVRARTKE